MLKKKWLAGIILGGFVATIGLAVENKGTAQIELDGGSRGVVPFSHRTHQEKLTDCNVCHSMFPQEPQSLAKLKTNGQLKPKEIMNKQCIKCHQTEKKSRQQHHSHDLLKMSYPVIHRIYNGGWFPCWC